MLYEVITPYFVTDPERMECTLEDAHVLIHEKKISSMKDLLPILEQIAKTGKPLVINYDYYAPATPERKPEIDWVVRQFAKLGIQLEVRATDNNQFQDT